MTLKPSQSVKLSTARYRQLLRKEETLVEDVKPLVEKLHRITRQQKSKAEKIKIIN